VTLRTYRAFTMTEALAAVKRDLGADAAILHTRTFRRGGMFGFGRRTVVEVTASRSGDREAQLSWMAQRAEIPVNATASVRSVGAAARTSAPSRAGIAEDGLASGPIDLLAAIEQHKREANSRQRAAGRSVESAPAAMVEGKAGAGNGTGLVTNSQDMQQRAAASARSRVETIAPPDVHPRSISPDWVEGDPEDGQGLARGPAILPPVAQRFILTRVSDAPGAEATTRTGGGRGREVANRVARSNVEATQSPLLESIAQPVRMRAAEQTSQKSAAHEEMRAIREMVGQILQHQAVGRTSATPAMPAKIFDLYLRLRGQEVSEEIADHLAQRVQTILALDEREDAARVRAAMRTELMALTPVQPTDLAGAPKDGRPLTIALIGPTGVGKTTTLAKLAATIKLHHGRRVGLITCDTYRIAAVEQLRTYANIISVPLRVVLTPQEMVHACQQFRDTEVILIDTAGRSQRDREKLGELSKFIQAAQPHEVHMVLSSTAGERVLAQEAGSFSAVRCDRLIITKIDEAVSYGLVLNLLRQVGKPLSFITTGQEVPDHLEPASAGRIAELILG